MSESEDTLLQSEEKKLKENLLFKIKKFEKRQEKDKKYEQNGEHILFKASQSNEFFKI